LAKMGKDTREDFMNREGLTEKQSSTLRENGLLAEGEFAYRAGDLIIAENPVTGDKRVLGQATSILTENNRRVLRG